MVLFLAISFQEKELVYAEEKQVPFDQMVYQNAENAPEVKTHIPSVGEIHNCPQANYPDNPSHDQPNPPDTSFIGGSTSGGESGTAASSSSGLEGDTTSTGSISNGSTRIQPVRSNQLQGLQTAVQAAQHASQKETQSGVLNYRKQLQEMANQDQKLLNEYYKNLTLPQLQGAFDRASGFLDQYAKYFEQAKPVEENLSGPELMNLRNTFSNARDKAQAGKELALDPEGRVLKSPGNPLAKTDKLSELFSDHQLTPLSPDAMIDRLIMLNGMIESERVAMLARLRLAEQQFLQMNDGSLKKIALLHNGERQDVSHQNVECYKMLSAMISPEVRKLKFTAQDFYSMWLLQRSGKMPSPPLWSKKRAQIIRTVAKGFIPINPYLGEPMRPGDLLVYHVPGRTNGQVYMIKEYSPQTMMAQLYVTHPSTAQIRVINVPLTVDANPATPKKQNLLHHGFFPMRLKPNNNEFCSYQDQKKSGGSK